MPRILVLGIESASYDKAPNNILNEGLDQGIERYDTGSQIRFAVPMVPLLVYVDHEVILAYVSRPN